MNFVYRSKNGGYIMSESIVGNDSNESIVDTQKIYEVVLSSTEADIPLEMINEESSLRNDLLFDSISFMTLALHLERQFGLKISNIHEEFYRVIKVGDLIKLINNQFGKKHD